MFRPTVGESQDEPLRSAGSGALRNFTASLLVTVIFFGVLEGVLRFAYYARNSVVKMIPLPYVIGADYGPVPPWLDGLRLLEPDPVLVWKARPNLKRTYLDVFSPIHTNAERISLLRQFLPRVPESLRGNPRWEISLNSAGYRDIEFPRSKDPSSFRILCLGDSWTFGANVGEDQTYPRKLQAILQNRFPSKKIEVLNMGVLGYSSFHGAHLMNEQIPKLQPDLVVIAYAMNEENMNGYREPAAPTGFKKWRTTTVNALGELESFKLLRFLSQVIKYEPEPMSSQFVNAEKHTVWTKFGTPGHPDDWMRPMLNDYELYHTRMIEKARSLGADVILVYNHLIRITQLTRSLERLAGTYDIQVVDSSALLEKARGRMESDLEAKLSLKSEAERSAAPAGQVDVVFRVYENGYPAPAGMFISGDKAELGNLIPNKIQMYDDGSHGDQRADDNVWSYSVRLPADSEVFYVYTNGGTEGRWEGMDIPQIRMIRTPKTLAGKYYAPIDSFGKMYMEADPWHTNAAGYELIANAVFKDIIQLSKFRQHMGL
jgi:lysophospholipase L1-like esterase